MAAWGRGVIVNGGKVAAPTYLAGGAANAALMLVTAGLAQAYAGRGIWVVGINPGLTRTDRGPTHPLLAPIRDGAPILITGIVQAGGELAQGYETSQAAT